MKFALTITEIDAGQLPVLLNFLTGTVSTAAVTINQPVTATAGDDADDNAPANVNAPAVDSTGLPHDERIHSAAKSVTATGAWRKRKGVADSLVTAVEAELRARGAQPAPAAAMPFQPAPMVTQPVAMPMPATQPAPMQPQYPTGPGYPQQPGNVQPGPLAASLPYQPQPMQPAQPAPAPVQPQAPAALDFNMFMQTLSGKMTQTDANGAPLVDAAYCVKITAEISAAFQVPLNVITDIASQPRVAEMVNYAAQLMQRDGKW